MSQPVDTGNTLSKLLLRSENPTGVSGPLPHAAVRAAAGAGIGGLIGKFTAKEGNKRAMRLALIGALLGGATSIPEMSASIKAHRMGLIPNAPRPIDALMSPYPFNKAGAWGGPDFTKLLAPKSGIAAKQVVMQDTSMSPIQKLQAINLVNEAERDSQLAGTFNTLDLIQAGAITGLGYGAGKVLGAVFGLPDTTQKRLAQVGAVGSLLRATGVWSTP